MPQIPEADRDGYWTNLNFLNSLRELGNTVSLLESDVPDYLTGLRSARWTSTRAGRAYTMELTSRRRSDEIPKAIEQLQVALRTARRASTSAWPRTSSRSASTSTASA